jgi:glycosyltransferase involved in cell wall biosynthesis
MKLLTIATSFPYPPDNGTKIQVFERVRALSDRHDVTLLCVSSESVSPDRVREMERYCRCVFITTAPYEGPTTSVGKVCQLIRSFWLREPYYIHDRVASQAQAWLERQVDRERFDVVEADDHAGAYLRSPFRAIKVVILHHVEDTSARRELALETAAVGRWTTVMYNRLTHWYEASVFRAVNLCVTLTLDNERDLRRLYPEARVRNCLSNGVDLEYFAYEPPVDPPNGICFVGKMDYAPNVDAVLWFCRHVFPLVRRELPTFRLSIVGGHPTNAVTALARDGAVEVTGYVDDVRPWVRQSGITALPMRMGGGILNKLLQSLALGVPVVATSRSLEGIAALPGRDLLVDDSPEGLAAKIVQLATDRDLRLRVAANGRRYVAETHQWSAMVMRYETELSTLLRERRFLNRVSAEQMTSPT